MKIRNIFCLPFGLAACLALGASLASAQDSGDDQDSLRVSGTDCVPPVPEIGYRPSLWECNGNAAILLRGNFRNAYSVVVRTIGQYNDRDPNNTSCSSARCSPYKVQKRIELPEYQVNCLGASGFSDYYNAVTRISVKFTASITNSLDPHQFQQYCLNSKKSSLN